MSKLKHMRKNQGFSRIKFNDNAYQTACLYESYIFRICKKKKQPITIFSNILIICGYFGIEAHYKHMKTSASFLRT